jgi:hypothetical protein
MEKRQYTFDKIFNKSKIKIDGKYKELNFSIFAEMWLEENGIKLSNLGACVADRPAETIFKLAFAGLPHEEYRDEMAFGDFKKRLESSAEGQREAAEIVERMDYILACFFKHLVAAVEKAEVERIEKISEEEVKKNSLKR